MHGSHNARKETFEKELILRTRKRASRRSRMKRESCSGCLLVDWLLNKIIFLKLRLTDHCTVEND